MDTPDLKGGILTPEEAAMERDLLAMKLRAQFGMGDGFSSESMTPEMELAFLQQVYAFEKHYTAGEPAKSFRESMDIPVFDPWPDVDISWEAAEEKVEYLMQWYRDRHVEVVFEYDYPAKTKYDFLSLELPDSPNYYGGEPQIQTVISYETYHPNHNADIERQTEAFMEHFFNRNAEGFQDVLWRDQIAPSTGAYDGQLLLEYLENWFAGISGFEKHEFHILETSYDFYDAGQEAIIKDGGEEEPSQSHGMGYAEGLVGYMANSLLQSEPIKVAGPFKLYFEYRQGHWAIVYPQFPGLPIPPEG
jgi:hypothetical protein